MQEKLMREKTDLTLAHTDQKKKRWNEYIKRDLKS